MSLIHILQEAAFPVQERLFFFLNYVFRMENMWKDKVFWGSRSSLGMTWNEFSWWVMGAWTHILFSFSIQRGFHIDACLLQLVRSVCTSFPKTSERKHWLKVSTPGVMRISGRTVSCWMLLLSAFHFSFLRNSKASDPLSTSQMLL